MSAPYDVVVIGGGPAGQAACLAMDAGARIAVIDEQPRPGGQILRRPPQAFRVEGWLPGREYRRLKSQLSAFEALTSVNWLGGCAALGVHETAGGWTVLVSGADGVREVTGRRLLIATGCYDMPRPLPGWTLPGVMSTGGVQAFVKSQQLTPGRRIVFAGSHPLQLLAASQTLKAGGDVAVVAFPQTLPQMIGRLMRHAGAALAGLPQLLSTLKMIAGLRRRGVSVRFGCGVQAIEGEGRVQSVRFRDGRSISCDAAALCFGFMPQSDLPRAMGLKVRAARPGGWRAAHDDWMRASRPGVYVAGETTGVKGAEAASAEGALAGLAMAMDGGWLSPDQAERRAAPLRRARGKAAAFAALLEDMGDAGQLDVASDAAPLTLACRCEDVSIDELRAAIERCPDANAVKLATRCGMGPCQGRNCEHILLGMLGAEVGQGEGFTARFPIRPTPIGDLLAPH